MRLMEGLHSKQEVSVFPPKSGKLNTYRSNEIPQVSVKYDIEHAIINGTPSCPNHSIHTLKKSYDAQAQ